MVKKKSSWSQSEFGKIKLVNIFNAVYHTIVAVIPMWLSLAPIITEEKVNAIAIVAGTVFFGSIFKGMSTNTKGQPFTKE